MPASTHANACKQMTGWRKHRHDGIRDTVAAAFRGHGITVQLEQPAMANAAFFGGLTDRQDLPNKTYAVDAVLSHQSSPDVWLYVDFTVTAPHTASNINKGAHKKQGVAVADAEAEKRAHYSARFKNGALVYTGGVEIFGRIGDSFVDVIRNIAIAAFPTDAKRRGRLIADVRRAIAVATFRGQAALLSHHKFRLASSASPIVRNAYTIQPVLNLPGNVAIPVAAAGGDGVGLVGGAGAGAGGVGEGEPAVGDLAGGGDAAVGGVANAAGGGGMGHGHEGAGPGAAVAVPGVEAGIGAVG